MHTFIYFSTLITPFVKVFVQAGYEFLCASVIDLCHLCT